MQPSKSVSSDSTLAPLASGCRSWATETLPRGRITIAGMPAGAQKGGERRRGVAGRSAGHGADAGAFGEHLPHHRDEDRHAEVLERSGVRVAALLDRQDRRRRSSAQAADSTSAPPSSIDHGRRVVLVTPLPRPYPPSRTARWRA